MRALCVCMVRGVGISLSRGVGISLSRGVGISLSRGVRRFSDHQTTGSGERVWKRFDDGFIVRSMSPQDADVVTNWYNTNMGVISRHDLHTALSCFPPQSPGFYMGEYKGQPVASAVRVPWGDNVLYGSLYYVDIAHRRHKFGSRLRSVAEEFVGKRTLCMDAVPGNVTADSTKRLSAVLAYENYRYSGVARVGSAGASVNIVKASEIPLDKLISYDDECFVSRGFPVRRNFLSKWINLASGASFVAVDGSGHVTGYGCRHPAINAGNHLVGPLYANTADIAETLLNKLCSDITGQHFCINISSQNKNALDLMKKFDLKKEFAVNRMYTNGNPQESKNTVYAFTSLDVCAF